MRTRSNLWVGVLVGLLCASARGQTLDAKAIVQQAVATELAANHDDQSHWRYRKSEADGSSYIVVETENGAITRHVSESGQPASDATLAADNARIQKFIHDPGMQQKQRANGAHDDKSATELMNLMTQAFFWTVVSETPETTTLAFQPDPSFHPPNMEARVMGAMSGTLVVDRAQHRICTMKGTLEHDVTIGFGFLARIKQGSVFDVERRQVAPGYWQITETHVHIRGHALFFKTIGQQEDEGKTDFTLVPAGTSLEQAVELLNDAAK
jgi:hypothetical protein